MVRKTFIAVSFLIILLTSWSCSSFLGGRLHKEYDEFMGSDKITLSQVLIEKEKSYNLEEAEINYLFEKRNGIENAEVYFAIPKVPEMMPLERDGFIKVDESLFEVPLIMFRPFKDRKNHNQEEMAAPSDSAKTSGPEKMKGMQTYYVERFSLKLPSEVVEGIRNGGKLSFRFYFGPETATYNIRGMKMKKVRKLLYK